MREIIERARKNKWMHEETEMRVLAERPFSVSITDHKNAFCYTLSINDLLADESFCKAVFGDVKCEHWRKSISDKRKLKLPTFCFDAAKCSECLRDEEYPYITHCKALSTIFSREEKIKYIKTHMINGS